MREISFARIVEEVEKLCATAACDLPEPVRTALHRARDRERSELGRSILDDCLENGRIAARERLPLCQDTGIAVFLVRLGQDVRITGGLLSDAITDGTRRGYAGLRKSVATDPLFARKNSGDNTPPVIHLEIVPGDSLTIELAPKGAGSENMSALAMLKPSDGARGVKRFVVDTVVRAGGNPCPPTIIGVGIGGTFEIAALLAKRALFRPVGSSSPVREYATLEREILESINASGTGPQGLGGSVTALAVHIESRPCHIASLPVAVNLNCHAARHARIVL